jgi:hypothetical protein
MSTISTRILRLTASAALVVGLGMAGAGPALATSSTWSGSAPRESIVAAEDDASPDGIGKPSGITAIDSSHHG